MTASRQNPGISPPIGPAADGLSPPAVTYAASGGQLSLGLASEATSPTKPEPPAVPIKPALSEVWVKRDQPVPSPAYETYWRFATERQAVFFRRLGDARTPWTTDPILRRYKFTNAYRASDRVSQFLIREVIYGDGFDAQDTFFRLMIFKLFNKVETWQLLEEKLGSVSWQDYTFANYDRIFTEAMASGRRIYSAAYIMPSGRVDTVVEPTKHRFHLRLLEMMMKDEMASQLSACRTMREAFAKFRAYPSIGNFLAYQFVTDVNYSTLTSFSETEFVQPGPGALDGIRKCFVSLGAMTEADVIALMMDRQEAECGRLGLEFQSLWGRRLQLIDCQNLFCEVGKYARVRHPEIAGASDRKRIKQHFAPNTKKLSVWYPPKWGLNELIASDPMGRRNASESHEPRRYDT